MCVKQRSLEGRQCLTHLFTTSPPWEERGEYDFFAVRLENQKEALKKPYRRDFDKDTSEGIPGCLFFSYCQVLK